MKKALLTLFIFSFFAFSFSFSYGQSWVWGREAGVTNFGSASGDIGMDHTVAVDNDDNAYMVGNFSGKLIFGNDTIISSGLSEPVFLVKYDGSGNVLWVRQATGNSNMWGSSVAVDEKGNAYIIGSFQDSIFFGTYKLKSIATNGDMFIVKYDQWGNVLWAEQTTSVGYYSYAYGQSVAVDNLGNVYMAGKFRDTISLGSDTLKEGNYATNMFLAKYNSAGNIIWVKQANCSSWSSSIFGNSVALDTLANLFVTGSFIDTVSIGAIRLVTKSNYGVGDVFIAKYDSSGNPLWVEKADENSFNSYGAAHSIAVERSGNAYITGYFKDTLTFGSTKLIEPNSNDNVFLAKYKGNSGNVLWAVQGENISNNDAWEGYSVACDTLKGRGGYLILSGGGASHLCELKFGKDTFKLNTVSGVATVLLQFDSSGNVLCGNMFTEGHEDDGDGVGVSHSGQFIYFGGDLTDTTIIGTDTLPYEGNDIPFIARWQPCSGNEAGITPIKPNQTISVYPNPFSNSTTIAVSTEGKHSLEVYDLTGRRIESVEFTGKQYELSAQGLTKGMYFVRVFDESSVLIGASKIVVE